MKKNLLSSAVALTLVLGACGTAFAGQPDGKPTQTGHEAIDCSSALGDDPKNLGVSFVSLRDSDFWQARNVHNLAQYVRWYAETFPSHADDQVGEITQEVLGDCGVGSLAP